MLLEVVNRKKQSAGAMELSSTSSTPASTSTDVTNSPLAGVSQKNWDKFLSLQKRREAVTRHSTEKRINEIKNSIITKVKEDFTCSDELEALKTNNVDLSCVTTSNAINQRRKSKKSPAVESGSTSGESSLVTNESKTGWLGIKDYLSVNDHLMTTTNSGYNPRSHLEEKIDEALAVNDVATAEGLSDRLAIREFGTKITKAIDAKRFAEKRKQEEEMKKANKKKKLAWGFEHKQRWETKGNM